jgi:hypothetical protein
MPSEAMPDRFIHRTLKVPASEYEKVLAGALLGILGRSIHDLAGIVAALNQTEIKPRNAGVWTEELFVAEMERLGVYPNSTGAPLGEHGAGIVPPGATTPERPKRPTRGGTDHAR